MTATLLKRNTGKGTAGTRRVGRARRHFRVRKRVVGTDSRPRLVVSRSLRHIVAQLVDDSRGHTLVSASSMEASVRSLSGAKSDIAKAVGETLAGRAREAGVTRVVFDRGGNKYAGRIAALADAARASGLEF